jgi:molybdenum cofactor cytidylyltransferase
VFAVMQLAVVILAAGASSRMGRPKMLLPWGASTVLGHLIAQWQQVGAKQIAVVCAAGDAAISAELDRIAFPREQRIVNPEPARGMFSSIQCAARWPDWNAAVTHWAIALGDQPHLANETFGALEKFSAQNLEFICQPARNGRARHPVFLPKQIFQQLAASPHATLKEFLDAYRDATRLLELPDAGIDWDLDTPADYESITRQAFSASRAPRASNE